MMSRWLVVGLCLLAGFRADAVIADPLPGTQPLTLDKPLDEAMVDGIDRFCLKAIADQRAARDAQWKLDFASREAYLQSVKPQREKFRTIIGAVDPRVATRGLELIANAGGHTSIAESATWTVHTVSWRVFEGVTGTGLLFRQKHIPVARVIALPDADWTPEQYAGLAPGLPPERQLPRQLADRGCEVLVPMLISRDDTHSGNPVVAMTNQPHREFVYRPAFEMGRHVIGYEVAKIEAAIDAFEKNGPKPPALPLVVAGIGEGGLLALFASAVDPRIEVTLVSGYFGPREDVWQEPIYRNVWLQLSAFGDAEIARLVAPRTLLIEACAAPEVAGPPAAKPGRRGGSAPGRIVNRPLAAVRDEFSRAVPVYEKLGAAADLVLAPQGAEGLGEAASLAVLEKKLTLPKPRSGDIQPTGRSLLTADERQAAQVRELTDHTQRLVRASAVARDKFWSKADRTNVETWTKSAKFYRDYVYDEMIGRLPASTISPNPRSRKVLVEATFTGYEVVLDLHPDVIAGGILLLPKDLKEGEKRPVVVCQHGLEGVPMDTITRTGDGFKYYKAFAAELASRGFITFAPQNPYRGMDRFRTLQRKSNPLGRSLFSYIIPQHQRILDFLKMQPNVDPKRIGFYGLSYGGKTAVRVPPMLEDYALSICSADFNEWIVKNTSVDSGTSYVFTGEYEIFEWNMGHVANYAELSSLMTPRPFMVERGHTDGVAPDEWVLWEFAKVNRHYDFVGLPGLAKIEVFNGPHTINGQGTYEFLHQHLNWPKR